MTASASSAERALSEMRSSMALPHAACRQPVHAVVVNLDSTIVDSCSEVTLAVNSALIQMELTPLPREIVETLDRGVPRAMMKRVLDSVGGNSIDLDIATSLFHQHYANVSGTFAPLLPEARAGLCLMHAAGFKLGIITGKPRHVVEALLSRLGIDGLFSVIVVADLDRRYHFSVEPIAVACKQLGVSVAFTLMIGNGENDILAARAVGCTVWSIPFGYGVGNTAGAPHCDRLIMSLSEAAHLLATDADVHTTPFNRSRKA